jgi:two-component system, chemotaxis family, protein-glutamate methylesterase/glutaminase
VCAAALCVAQRTGHGARPISVLIVDDSAVARAAMARMVSGSDDLVLAMAVEGANQAIAWLHANRVDVVLLDLEMPGVGGLAALPDLLVAGRGAHILIVSSTAREGAEATIRALAAGAADTLTKPSTDQLNQNFGKILVDRIHRLGRAVAVKGEITPYSLRRTASRPIGLLAIGASTGGLNALAAFFENLPVHFAAPILITQHLPPAFMGYFADQVGAMAGRFARVAQEGDPLVDGEILVAPGHAHLTVLERHREKVISLSTSAAPTRCCPSVDPMLRSVAETAGEEAVAVVLSGMGRDGAAGAAAIVAGGGSVIVQDRSTSAVWGMPGAVAVAGHASLVATPQRLAEHIARRGSL